MKVKRFALSDYKNATEDFYITRITAPTEALALHSHDYFQIYYLVSGRLNHYLENTMAALTAGDIFILPPNQPHYIQRDGAELDFYSLSFSPDFFQNAREGNKLILDFLLHLQQEQTEKIPPKITLSYEDTEFASALFDRIMGEFSGQASGKNEMIREMVSVLLSLFARVYFQENVSVLTARENRQLVTHSIEYMKAHFDEELTLREMVERSAMSKTNFCAIFSAITGMSFKEYLNRYRIRRAAELIAGGEKVALAGTCCGFNDFSTFYRNFRKYMGVSPSAFSKKNKEKG